MIAPAAVLVSTWLAAGAVAVAEDARPEQVVSLKPLAFLAGGMAAQYERQVGPPRLSVVGGLGWRSGGDGDFVSRAIGLTTEVRWWMTGRWRRDPPTGRGQVGPFFLGRAELTRVGVRTADRGRMVGHTHIFSESLGVGWRVSAWNVEVSPSVALGIITHTGDGFVPSSRPGGEVGLTVGYRF